MQGLQSPFRLHGHTSVVAIERRHVATVAFVSHRTPRIALHDEHSLADEEARSRKEPSLQIAHSDEPLTESRLPSHGMHPSAPWSG
eukprot:1240251-Prymnesium_polylepis.3